VIDEEENSNEEALSSSENGTKENHSDVAGSQKSKKRVSFEEERKSIMEIKVEGGKDVEDSETGQKSDEILYDQNFHYSKETIEGLESTT
jgi:hypothetical protein